MIAESMRVGLLRIRSRTPLTSSVGLSARVQDALRTSSKPSSWNGRVILVRRLRVRLREEAPPHEMTTAFEREWQRLARGAVDYTQASPASEAVWFDSQVDARLALIARLATGADLSAWFWRRLLPLEANASRDEQLLTLFAAPWTDLPVSDEAQMRFAWQAFAALGSKPHTAQIVAALSETALRRLLPTLSHEEEVVEKGSPLTKRASGHGTRIEHRTNAADANGSFRSRALRMACAAIDGHGHDSERNLIGSRNRSEVGRASLTARAIDEGVSSRWAGLFFALNLLEHAGDAPSAPDETVAVLHAAATWLRIEPDEPIYDVLTALSDGRSRPDVPPARIRALRLACLTLTRRPLRRIVSRAGRIMITATHVTIVFDLASVRLDVRKAGLDLDPGWLPRLGRVVRFEYE